MPMRLMVRSSRDHFESLICQLFFRYFCLGRSRYRLVCLTDSPQALIADKEAGSSFGQLNDFYSFIEMMVLSGVVSS